MWKIDVVCKDLPYLQKESKNIRIEKNGNMKKTKEEEKRQSVTNPQN